MESIVGIIYIVVLAAVVFARIRTHRFQKRWIAADVVNMLLFGAGLLFLESFWNFDGIGASVAAVLNLGFIVLMIVLTLAGWKHLWMTYMFIGITYLLLLLYPGIYNAVFPNNNMAEDILWEVHTTQSTAVIILIAAALTWCMKLFNILEKRYGGLPIPVAVATVLAVLVILLLCIAIGRGYVRRSSKANAVAPYEYLAAAENTEGEWGFINERGETVIPFVYKDFKGAKGFKDTFLAYVSTDAGNYLVNEEGKIVCDAYSDYVFADHSQYVIAQKASGYGVIDAAMNEVTDFFYDLPGEVIQAYPEYFPAQKETLSILEDPEESGGFSNYVADQEGNVIIPSGLGYISFSSDHQYILVNAGWFITEDSTGRHAGGCGLYDREGKAIIPLTDTRGLWAESDNGWILSEDVDGHFYFVDVNDQVMLDLGKDYTSVRGMKKIRQ